MASAEGAAPQGTVGRLFQGVSRQEFGFKMLQSMGWSEGQARSRRARAAAAPHVLTPHHGAGARRVRHGHHQAHCGREAPRPNRRVRLDARHGGSGLIDARAGIGADIARDSSAKIEWSVNMQNFDQILAGARLSAARRCALRP